MLSLQNLLIDVSAAFADRLMCSVWLFIPLELMLIPRIFPLVVYVMIVPLIAIGCIFLIARGITVNFDVCFYFLFFSIIYLRDLYLFWPAFSVIYQAVII